MGEATTFGVEGVVEPGGLEPFDKLVWLRVMWTG
jgi:hypothetical protein